MKRATLPCLLLAVAASGASAQTPTWKAEVIGTGQPGWGITAPTAVNDSGVTVGLTYLSGFKRAWIAGPGLAMQLLPTPPDVVFSDAFDINSSGVVAGGLYLSSGLSRGVLWRPGPAGYELVELPAAAGGVFPFNALGLNDAGDVVGKLGILSNSYHYSSVTDVVTQLTVTEFPGIPYDVNEQRQVIDGTLRMDLDTMVLEDLGNPTGTTYGYQFTELSLINDAGECAGYAVTGSSSENYLPVRYTDGPSWKVYSNFPLSAAGVISLAASGDVTFQLGIFGTYVYVDGVGSIGLQSMLDPAYAHFSLGGNPVLSRGGLVACMGTDTIAGQGGVVLLSPLGFEDLGGAVRGALGDPVLGGYGSLVPGEPVRVRLASAAQNSVAIFAWSTSSTPIPLFGGVFHANPSALFATAPTNALGRVDFSFAWPSAPAGEDFFLQAAVLDPAAAAGVSMSNGLRGVTK